MVVRLVALLPILATLVLYVVWTAQRLDGLHARVDAAGAALDLQLRRRARAALDCRVPLLTRAALDALAAQGLGPDREQAESRLSLALAATDLTGSDPPARDRVADESVRAAIARVFYNDTVRDALVVRDRRLVRWGRLAGTAPHPAYLQMADGEPPSPESLRAARSTPLAGRATDAVPERAREGSSAVSV